MKIRMSWTLGKKLFVFSLLSILLVVSISSFFVWQDSQNKMRERERDTSSQLVRVMRVKLDKLFKDAEARLLRPYTEANELELPRLQTVLEQWYLGQPINPDDANYIQINLNLAGGNGLQQLYVFPYSMSKDLILRSALTQDDSFPEPLPNGGIEFTPLQKQFVTSLSLLTGKDKVNYTTTAIGGFFNQEELLRKEAQERRYFVAGTYLKNESDPNLDVVVLGQFEWSVFENIFSDLNEEVGNQTIILNNDNMVLYAKDESLIGKAYSDLIPIIDNHQEYMVFKDGNERLVAQEKSNYNEWRIVYIQPTDSMYASSRVQWLIVGAILLLLTAVLATGIAFFTKVNISRPIQMLSKAMGLLGKDALNIERVKVTSNDEIGDLGNALNFTISLVEQVNADAIRITNQKQSLQNLLDNSGQGFVTFGADLLVHPEYSSECLWIFGDEVEGKDWVELLNMPDGESLRPILQEIFRLEDYVQKSVFISLLPTEWEMFGAVYEMEYKPIVRNMEIALMVIITNITAQKQLEEKIKNESKVLRMIVTITQQKADFLQSIREFQGFYREEMPELIETITDPKLLKELLFRRVHTYKGMFGQYGLAKTMGKLHQLESDIDLYNPATDPVEFLIMLMQNVQWDDVMAEDRYIIEDVLGKGFFEEKRQIVLDMEKYEELQTRFVEKLPENEIGWVKEAFGELQHRPFKELLQIYPRYVSDLSERFEKSIKQFNVEGGHTPVDLDRFRSFSKVLVHVFRNVVDHGIETREKRIDIGKDEVGIVFCRVIDPEEGSNEIIVEIGDDGNGIDTARLKAKALREGHFTEEEMATWTKAQYLDLIFHDGLSTKDEVSALSGRGVGMAAVKEESEALGGTLEVETELGLGTTFRWRLPVRDPNLL